MTLHTKETRVGNGELSDLSSNTTCRLKKGYLDHRKVLQRESSALVHECNETVQ